MEEVYQELIEAKLTLAETNESLLMKSQQLKALTETYAKKQEEIKNMQEEVQSLYDSISQISEERDNLLIMLQESPRSITIQSLDLEADHIIEANYSQTSSELWKTISENWPKVKLSKKLKNLSRKGIHSAYRGKIWQKVIENRLFVEDKLYLALSNKPVHEYDLPQDLKRKISQSQCESLNKVLNCFLAHRLDIQYSQSLAYLCFVFLAHMGESEAFYCLTNFINNHDIVRNFFFSNITAIQCDYKVVEHYLQKLAPELLNALREFGAYLDGMIMENICCMFARCAPVEYVSRLIDVVLFEDEQYFMRLSLAVFVCLNEGIREKDLNSVTNGLNNVHLYVNNPEKILKEAEKIKVDVAKMNGIRNSIRNRASAWF